VRFSWNRNKAAANRRKHGVTFEEATGVFLDPDRIEGYDNRHDEPRWIVIGVADTVLLVVAYAVLDQENEVIRLISARRADAQERRTYREFRA
jgi:uncharacterized DUF497 family protein